MTATPISTTLLPGVLSVTTDGILGDATYGLVRVDAVEDGTVAVDGGHAVTLVGAFPAHGAFIPAGTLPGHVADIPIAALVRFVGGGLSVPGCVGPAGTFRGPQGWGSDPRPFGASPDWAASASRMVVYSPPLPAGTYDLHVSDWPLALITVVVVGAITVVEQTFHSELYALRSEIPHPRDVGAASIELEPWP